VRLGRGIVGITDEGLVFVSKKEAYRRARKTALKVVGMYKDTIYVGRIRALGFVENPIYPQGCSPDYGGDGSYETAGHCIIDRDICRYRSSVNMSDGSTADVIHFERYKACRSWLCWVFARFINRFGWIRDECIEEYDNATLNRGNVGIVPNLILFAGSADGKLALFTPSLDNNVPSPPFEIEVQSMDYVENKIKVWRDVVRGTGIFIVNFPGGYVLPFYAFYVYPASVVVRPGFSGSNAVISD